MRGLPDHTAAGSDRGHRHESALDKGFGIRREGLDERGAGHIAGHGEDITVVGRAHQRRTMPA